MEQALGSYFRQILLQGLVLGLIAWLCLVLPIPLNIITLVLGLYIFWRIPKDPRTHWKRMFALVLGALLFGGSFSLLGHLGIRLPWLETSAVVRYVMDINPWILGSLAVVVAIVDVLTEYLHLKRLTTGGRLWIQAVNAQTLRPPKDAAEAFCGSGTVLLGSDNSATVSQIQLKLKGPLYWTGPRLLSVEIDDGSGIREVLGVSYEIKAHTNVTLRYYFAAKSGAHGLLFFWWSKAGFNWLPRVGAFLVRVNGRDGLSVSTPLYFDPIVAERN